MGSIQYESPVSLAALAHCLELADEHTHLLGGGTDLLLKFHGRPEIGATLIDLTSVAGLDAITVSDERVAIGANVTYSQISRDAFIGRYLPCLTAMAAQIGSIQIRNLARLPGNLANASPGGDSIGTLIALEAEVEILNANAETRFMKVADLVLGIGQTRLTRHDAIIGIQIPRPSSPRNGYGKIGMAARREVVIANVSLTMVFDFLEAERTILGARIALGSAAPKAYRVASAENLCLDKAPSMALEEALAENLRQSVAASIQGNPLFLHKLNDVQGLARDVFHAIFSDVL